MRGVVVTLLPQPDPARDSHGVYRRLRMLLHGMKAVCDEIEIVHFARPDQMTLTAQMHVMSSAFWGVPVSVKKVPLNVRRRSWQQTASLPLSLRYRRDFRPFLGSDQANALAPIVDVSPALILAHRLPAMVSLLQTTQIGSPILFDLDDVEHRVKARAAHTASSAFAKLRRVLEIPALVAAERRAVAYAAKTFVCSPVDRAHLSRLGFDVSRTVVVPNAMDIAETCPELSRSRSILFLGNYGHAPNAEAAERLITRIWPKVRTRMESARLIIAGDHPEHIPSFADHPPNVEFTGFVQDLEALYARTRIVCCPICNGGGTRLKLIEAASRGKPIAATTVAVEGLEFDHGREVLIHDNDERLALACEQLLQDDGLAGSFAAAAYQKARALYSLSDLSGRIALEIRACLAAHASTKDGSDGETTTRFARQFSRPLSPFPGVGRENR